MAFRQAPDFAALIARICKALRQTDLPFMLIGGQAVLLHGQPRLTEDIDITLGVDPGELPSVLEACEIADLDILPEEPDTFVNETFVLPARDPATSIRIDLIFSAFPYERQAIERAVRIDLSGESVPFATAEDLILHKLFSGRARDIEDIHGIILLRGESLDWEYMERWAREFSAVPGREDLPDLLNEIRSDA
ncbi:nucleotidyl transferase AbiEii/AbiGii toxin family protein [Gemmatimonadota bacterium]